MKKEQLLKILKIIISVIAIIAFIFIIIYLIPLMKDLNTRQGQELFKDKITNLVIQVFFMLFVLQIIQIMLVILPGEPLEILAGMCYGSVWGTIFIFASTFITSYIIITLVKKYGKNYIYHFFKKERIDKIENSKFFRNPRKVEIILIILFLIPGTPKDLLTYIAGMLPIKTIRLVLISTFARFPSVLSSTLAGSNIVEGKWEISILIYLFTFIVTGIFIFIINKLDKNKVTQDAIDSLK